MTKNTKEGSLVTYYRLSIPDASQNFKELCDKAFNEQFGEKADEVIKSRFNDEWAKVQKSDSESLYYIAAKIAEKCKRLGINYYTDDLSGNSFLAYITAITSVNPIKPHFYCKNCKAIEFIDGVVSGFDVTEEKVCSGCGERMQPDGHNLPCEFFMEFDGSKSPAFNFRIEKSGELELIDLIKNLVGSGYKIVTEDGFENYTKYIFVPTSFDGIVSDNEFDSIDIAFEEKICIGEKENPFDKFSDLVRRYGLFMGEREESEGDYLKLIAFREDVMLELMGYGLEMRDAFRYAEIVRKGKARYFTPEDEAILKDGNVPEWYISEMKRVKYLFPKSQAITHVMKEKLQK